MATLQALSVKSDIWDLSLAVSAFCPRVWVGWVFHQPPPCNPNLKVKWERVLSNSIQVNRARYTTHPVTPAGLPAPCCSAQSRRFPPLQEAGIHGAGERQSSAGEHRTQINTGSNLASDTCRLHDNKHIIQVWKSCILHIREVKRLCSGVGWTGRLRLAYVRYWYYV